VQSPLTKPINKTVRVQSPSAPAITQSVATVERKIRSQFEQDYLKSKKRVPSKRQITAHIQEKKVAADAQLKEIGTERLDQILRKFVYDHDSRGTKPQDMQPIYAHLDITDDLMAQNTVKVSTLAIAIGTAYQQLTSRRSAT
jgi:hypothetical protein